MAILPEFAAHEPRQVDFITAPPTAAAPAAPTDALAAARAHAHEQGLTDCVDPARARLDDVILTFPSEPLAGAVVTQSASTRLWRQASWVDGMCWPARRLAGHREPAARVTPPRTTNPS